METDTSRRVIESGSQQYNQFPFHSSPRKKRGKCNQAIFCQKKFSELHIYRDAVAVRRKKKKNLYPPFCPGEGNG